MLGEIDAKAMVAVKNLKKAKRFYEEVLGLKTADAGEECVLLCRSGRTEFLLYESQFAGTNQANALAWNVGRELTSLVEELKTKDIKFEHYELPGVTFADGIHRAGEKKLAWFKDPVGNILHMVGR